MNFTKPIIAAVFATSTLAAHAAGIDASTTKTASVDLNFTQAVTLTHTLTAAAPSFQSGAVGDSVVFANGLVTASSGTPEIAIAPTPGKTSSVIGTNISFPGTNDATHKLTVAVVNDDGSTIASVGSGSGDFVGILKSDGKYKVVNKTLSPIAADVYNVSFDASIYNP